jgi:aldose 1-epimerase
MLPNGRQAAADGVFDVASGGPLGGRKFDTYFTGLRADADGSMRTRLTDPDTRRTVTQTFASIFTQCIVYTPPHRQAICLEPYTCLPDPFRMAQAGHETGLQILAPGASLNTRLRIEVS